MILEWIVLAVVAFGPVALLLWGVGWLLLGRGPKPAARDRLVPRMIACRKALDLAGDPSKELRTCHDDTVVRICLEDPDNTQLPDLVVSVKQTAGGLNRQLPITADRLRPISLRRETKEDRLGKLLLVNRELQTGDPAFDDNVYVETAAPFDVASEALADRRVRDRVRRLLDDGWTRVVIHGRDLVRVEQVPTDEASVEPERIRRAVDDLRVLAGVLVPVVVDHPEADGSRLRRRLLTGSLAVAWLAGGALSIAGVRLWSPLVLTPFAMCAAATVILFLLGAPGLGLLVRGRSDSLHTLYGLLVWLGVALPPLCVGAALVANGALDEGARQEYVARVVAVERTSVSSQYAGYYARLESWIPGQESVAVPVSRGVYAAISSEPQARLRLSVGQGALGWPWCADVQKEP